MDVILGIVILILITMCIVGIILGVANKDGEKEGQKILQKIKNGEKELNANEIRFTFSKNMLATIYTALNNYGYEQVKVYRTHKYVVVDKEEKYHHGGTSIIGTFNNGFFVGNSSSSPSYSDYKLLLSENGKEPFWEDVSASDYYRLEKGMSFEKDKLLKIIWKKTNNKNIQK